MYRRLVCLSVVAGCQSTGGVEACPPPAPGQCPNACAPGSGVLGESCGASADCACGLECEGGACRRFEGALAACTCDLEASPGGPVDPLLGRGVSVPEAASLDEVLSTEVTDPADLAFNPARPFELWVVSPPTDAITVIHDVTRSPPSVETWSAAGDALLDEVDAIAFGPEGTFATCGETGGETGGDPGPALWPADTGAFGAGAGAALLDGVHGGAWCTGLESAGTGHAFYASNGEMGTIDRHELGVADAMGDRDPPDGAMRRYVDLGLARKPGVPGHLALDGDARWLYIADTGNHRVVRLDTQSGTASDGAGPGQPPAVAVTAAVLEEVVTAESGLLVDPSGILLHEGRIYVTDSAASTVSGFDEQGQRVALLATGVKAGGLAGIAVGPDGRLYAVDREGDRVLRIVPH